ncbi:uncharacterized protein TM35_000092260 [Trypanosoma theileri]|uniref:Uncharacterized protein n=1 Tax=Trypanosoma theileri TaxID=67003 RepID=A0A1X0NZR1_9TRYP|nr:uncharacterized protein TM35_000092260 [Trypanosoma theileri]ORC90176.1 hypothetical protein TM35_000092260 [Trypanosoma theileri]
MSHPACLPPRPSHTFSLRTVEKLYQRHLENVGAHVRPEQIPSFVEGVRRNLARIEEVLRYRLQRPAPVPNGEREYPLLSKFERLRVSHILADVVLDIATISIVSSSETYDAVVNTNTAVSLAIPRVGATPLLFCDTEETPCFHPCEHSSGAGGTVESAPLAAVGDVSLTASLKNAIGHSSMTEMRQNSGEQQQVEDRGRQREETTFVTATSNTTRTTTTALSLSKCNNNNTNTNNSLGSSGLLGSDGESDPPSAAMSRPNHFLMGYQKTMRSASPTAERLQGVPPSLQQRQNTMVSVDSSGNSSTNRRTWMHDYSHDTTGFQYPLSYSESPLSPTSVRFKPVLSMHSGAESSTTCPQHPRKPRKYYDIDLQKLSEFTYCLRAIQELDFTESDFEKAGLRYAIPGIRELDPSEAQSFNDRMDERYNSSNDLFNPGGEEEFTVKRTISLTTTGGGTETDGRSVCPFQRENNSSPSTTPPPMTVDMPLQESELQSVTRVSTSRSLTSNKPTHGTPQSETSATSPQPPPVPVKDHCLPLFRGGRDAIVKKKHFQLFVAMVQHRLKQVDQEVDGLLHIYGADLASSSGEEDTTYTS